MSKDLNEISLFLNKSINDNANFYFDKAKKLKNKLEGIDKIVGKTNKEIEDFKLKKEEYLKRKEEREKIEFHRKKEWYEKFRFTFTYSGFLMILGKDAGTNEVLVKKHLEENDIIIHTEAPGSPFGIVKGGRDKLDKKELEECMTYVACFSKQWKRGFGTADAFWVYPEQISKTANTGEFIAKGAFMVRGTKNIGKNLPLTLSFGIVKKKIQIDNGEEIEIEEGFSGSKRACEKLCGKKFVNIEPGQMKYKALNSALKKRLNGNFEDLPKFLPNECKVMKK